MKRVVRTLMLVTLAACASTARAADAKPLAAPPAAPAAASKPAVSAVQSAPAASQPMPTVVDSVGLLEREVAKDSSKFDNLYRLGVLYLDRDRVPEATRVLLKASQLRPKDIKVLVNLGAALDAAGNAAQAQDYYRKALVVSPDDSVAICRLASSLYAQSKFPDAVNMLREVIRNRPGAYCAYFTLGVAFADVGLYRDAIRMWRKVVELAPTSAEAVSAKESIEVLDKFVQQK